MQKIEGQLKKVLRTKPTVVTRAFFWKIPHNTPREDICLKIGRYKKSAWFDQKEEAETLDPKSELTLDHDEFKELIAYLQESYEPFRQGVKAFIPLDSPFEADNASQVKALFSVPQKAELVRFILDNDIIPDELADGLRQAKRVRAVREYRSMLDQDLVEQRWQQWFQQKQLGAGKRVCPHTRREAHRHEEYFRLSHGGLRRFP